MSVKHPIVQSTSSKNRRLLLIIASIVFNIGIVLLFYNLYSGSKIAPGYFIVLIFSLQLLTWFTARVLLGKNTPLGEIEITDNDILIQDQNEIRSFKNEWVKQIRYCPNARINISSYDEYKTVIFQFIIEHEDVIQVEIEFKPSKFSLFIIQDGENLVNEMKALFPTIELVKESSLRYA